MHETERNLSGLLAFVIVFLSSRVDLAPEQKHQEQPQHRYRESVVAKKGAHVGGRTDSCRRDAPVPRRTARCRLQRVAIPMHLDPATALLPAPLDRKGAQKAQNPGS